MLGERTKKLAELYLKDAQAIWKRNDVGNVVALIAVLLATIEDADDQRERLNSAERAPPREGQTDA